MRKVKAVFTGRVQGVGFRMSTCDVAQEFEVSGTVCNVSDGSVELVAIGEQVELDKLLQTINARFSRNIDDCRVEWSTGAVGELIGFTILPDKWG